MSLWFFQRLVVEAGDWNWSRNHGEIAYCFACVRAYNVWRGGLRIALWNCWWFPGTNLKSSAASVVTLCHPWVLLPVLPSPCENTKSCLVECFLQEWVQRVCLCLHPWIVPDLAADHLAVVSFRCVGLDPAGLSLCRMCCSILKWYDFLLFGSFFRLEPYADPYYDYEIERFWRGGQYENFRVQYTEAEPYHNYRVSMIMCKLSSSLRRGLTAYLRLTSNS